MDILKILKEQSSQIYPEDLDFFETELATGDYSAAYIKEAREKITAVRKRLTGESDTNKKKNSNKIETSCSGGVFLGLGDVAPKDANPAARGMSSKQLLFSDIQAIRKDSAYKTRFKKFVAENEKIDADFLDENYGFFEEWEMNAIVSVKQLGEPFLEKYFGAIDHDKISRYQLFSEAFFMKHFSQMDAKIVLEQGKNNWRKKENRSKQLDVFLRLKGIKY